MAPSVRPRCLVACALLLAAFVPRAAAPAGLDPDLAPAVPAAAAEAPPVVEVPPVAEVPPVVEVLTMTPGPHLFERFGHTALRIGDRVYNFGTFDPGDPQVVSKFLSHTLDYWLSVATPSAHYDRYENRTITRQRIALSPAEAFALARALEDNALPEHRAYRYDFFVDNCATRVRDAIDRATSGALSASVRGQSGTATYRGHVERVLAGVPLLSRGIALLLNGYTDAPITRWDDAFLPSQLEAILAAAFRADGRPLVARTTEWVGPRMQPAPRPSHLVEILLAVVLLAPLAFSLVLQRSNQRARTLLAGVALIETGLVFGLLGVVLAITALTPYACAHANANVLLLHPGLLALVPAGVLLTARRPRGASLARVVLFLSLVLVVIDLVAHALGSARQHNAVLALGVLAIDLLLLAATTNRPPRTAEGALAVNQGGANVDSVADR